MRILEVRELSFIFLSASCESDIFFMRLSVGSVVFVSGAIKRYGFRTNKVYGKNTLWTQYSRKIFSITACGSTLFVREEPVITFAAENENRPDGLESAYCGGCTIKEAD